MTTKDLELSSEDSAVPRFDIGKPKGAYMYLIAAYMYLVCGASIK